MLRWGFSYHPGLVEFCSYFDRWSSQSLPKEISFGFHFAGAGATEERSVHTRTCARTAKIRKQKLFPEKAFLSLENRDD